MARVNKVGLGLVLFFLKLSPKAVKNNNIKHGSNHLHRKKNISLIERYEIRLYNCVKIETDLVADFYCNDIFLMTDFFNTFSIHFLLILSAPGCNETSSNPPSINTSTYGAICSEMTLR